MIYNLPRKAKKKYTWYKDSVIRHEDIVTASNRSYIYYHQNGTETPSVTFYSSISNSNGKLVGYGSSFTSGITRYGSFDYYFEYNGNWWVNRTFEYGDTGDTLYAQRVYIDERYEKGTTSYGTVASTNENAYPEDGYQDGYWYVRKE